MNKPLTIIRNEQQYQDYMDEFMALIDANEITPGTDSFDRFELLSVLIEDYESKEFPIDKPSPLEAIKFRMEQQGLTQKDMQKYLGSKSKVSEVLSGKIPLSLNMIKKVHDGLGIPLDILIQTAESLVEDDNRLKIDENPKFLDGFALISYFDATFSDYFVSKTLNSKCIESPLQAADLVIPAAKKENIYKQRVNLGCCNATSSAAIIGEHPIADKYDTISKEFAKKHHENTISYQIGSQSIN